jgi:hypothetical protein
MNSMRWPSMRPSVAKWPRGSRGMLRLRLPACATVAAGATFREAVVAEAGAGVILSAICAMKVPRQIMMAAMIIMLRMTPHPVQKTRSISPRHQPNRD